MENLVENQVESQDVSDVDYRVRVKPDTGRPLHFWHRVLYVLLITVIVASLVIIIIQARKIDVLREQNAALRATVDALRLLTPIPSP